MSSDSLPRYMIASEVSVIINRSVDALKRDRLNHKGLPFYRLESGRSLYRSDDVQRAMGCTPVALAPLAGSLSEVSLLRLLRLKSRQTLRRWNHRGIGPLCNGRSYVSNHVEAWLCCKRVDTLSYEDSRS